MAFEFFTAGRIIVKQGASDEIGNYIDSLGKSFLVVLDPVFKDTPLMEKIKKQIEEMGARYAFYTGANAEPDIEMIDEAYELAMSINCDAVISIGGGTCMDIGKSVAVLITNGPPVIDYIEYVGKGKKITVDPVPFVAIPTTAGTGSEVTPGAVLGSQKMNFKRTMRDRKMVAKVAILDPVLTVGMPKRVTAQSGIDAMTHNIESYLTWRSTPLSDMAALKGIELAGKYLQRAYENGEDLEAREGMAIAGTLGGMALAASGLGAAHGIGMAIGIQYHVGHGESCGIVLPYVMEINAPFVSERMARIGEVLTGKRFDKHEDGTRAAVECITDLNSKIGIPKDYKHLNIPADAVPGLAKASFGTSMSSNPMQMEVDEWEEFISKLV